MIIICKVMQLLSHTDGTEWTLIRSTWIGINWNNGVQGPNQGTVLKMSLKEEKHVVIDLNEVG